MEKTVEKKKVVVLRSGAYAKRQADSNCAHFIGLCCRNATGRCCVKSWWPWPKPPAPAPECDGD
jgi:hypothetical protein